MITILFINRKLFIAKDLPKGQKYNQDYFLSEIPPELEREKSRYKRRKRDGIFYVHMDHSKSHDSGKIQENFETKHLACAPHPAHSPDPSPCDFWFFRMANEKMQDREFHTVQDILVRLTQIWNDLTFEALQFVFCEWQVRLNWIIEYGREYYSE
jgi:hypothetical protein